MVFKISKISLLIITQVFHFSLEICTKGYCVTTMIYGGFKLITGDRDRGSITGTTNIYGGRSRPADQTGNNNDPKHVSKLQEDLIALGFNIVGKVDGAFGPRTEMAVREFKYYASLEVIARQVRTPMPGSSYADTLVSVDNPMVFRGPKNRVVDELTRQTIAKWLDEAFRCPVVIEGWTQKSKRPHKLEPMARNLWHAQDYKNSKLTMYARDFTGLYGNDWPEIPGGSSNQAILGYFWGGSNTGIYGGPVSTKWRHTVWPSAEILPETLIGKSWSELASDQKSSFRVIRVVAEQECSAYFDSVNSWDNCAISFGPCHHTLGIYYSKTKKFDKGELGAHLAYVKDSMIDSYSRFGPNNGIHVHEKWSEDYKDMRLEALRKYETQILIQGDSGAWESAQARWHLDYFRNWHWFYRTVMLLRTDEELRHSFWFATRLRIHDVLQTPWRNTTEHKLIYKDGSENRDARIGDVFKSELAVAILNRLHIWRPARVVKGKKASAYLVMVVKAAKISESNTAKWENSDEKKLVEALLKLIADKKIPSSTHIRKQIVNMSNWPSKSIISGRGWSLPNSLDKEGLQPLGRKRAGRGAFKLDNEGLPND